jgi:AcrR family transcriptional regulator
MKMRTEARRVAIIEAAASVFLEMGYERASMNEVSKRCGGSKTTLYGYFPSKEELFGAVVRVYATAHLSEAVADLVQDNDRCLAQVLSRFGERMLMVLTNDGTALAVYRMVIAEAGRSEIGHLFYESGPSECINRLATLMAEAMQQGTLRQADPHLCAQQFLALLTAENDARVFQQAPAPLDLLQVQGMVERAVDMFLMGAKPR